VKKDVKASTSFSLTKISKNLKEKMALIKELCGEDFVKKCVRVIERRKQIWVVDPGVIDSHSCFHNQVPRKTYKDTKDESLGAWTVIPNGWKSLTIYRGWLCMMEIKYMKEKPMYKLSLLQYMGTEQVVKEMAEKPGFMKETEWKYTASAAMNDTSIVYGDFARYTDTATILIGVTYSEPQEYLRQHLNVYGGPHPEHFIEWKMKKGELPGTRKKKKKEVLPPKKRFRPCKEKEEEEEKVCEFSFCA
jgi:hypothetical protein